MESYTNFAEVYDTFMDQTSYEDWADRLLSMMKKYGRKGNEEGDRLVVDLGCGTGKVTEMLADLDYQMIGVDLSVDMLGIAQNRKMELGHDTLYVCQDMRNLELGSQAGTFISVGDSINYLLTTDDLVRMFKGVREYLLDNGIFVFDFKTLHLYRDVIGDRTIAEDREDCAFIWDNWFDEEKHINEYDLTLFIHEPEDERGIFRRYEEVHYQRGYTLEEVKEVVKKAGLIWVTETDTDTDEPVTDQTERILAVVRKEESRA